MSVHEDPLLMVFFEGPFGFNITIGFGEPVDALIGVY
jgi:hypothetical protein